MKSRPLKILIALAVTLLIAGGSYWQINFNKDWRQQYAYAKGVDAMVDAANRFYHSGNELADPKKYRDGGMPRHARLGQAYEP